MSTNTERLKKIKEEVFALKDTELTKFRNKEGSFPVIGEGSHDPNIIFIGEAPGRNEAKTGRPFCGAAGKILDELLESINLNRKEVYVTNIVKDRPPQNRDPLPEEIAQYGPFLDRQIRILKPKAIATLGRYAMEYILKLYSLEDKLETISNAHGKVYKAEGVDIIPLYHPAAAIYNRQLIDTQKEDFKILKQYI